MSADPAFAIDEALGVRSLDPGALPGADQVVGSARELVEGIGFDNLPWAAKKTNMAKYLLDGARLELDSPFMSLALSDPVIASVTDYLGVVPILNYVDLWCSRHIDEPASRSQLWHLDNADVRQVKLFVYCSDVDSDCGPLTILDASASERLSNEIGYSLAEGRVTDETVEQVVGRESAIELTGKTGTAYLVDTSRCFHFGSRVAVPGRSRLVAMFQYLTPYAFTYSADHREQAPFRELAADDAPPIRRLLLGAA